MRVPHTSQSHRDVWASCEARPLSLDSQRFSPCETKFKAPVHETSSQSAPTRRWSPRSLAILILAWLILQVGGLFTPGLLDDVDSVYIEIAREMMQRHDYVTTYINGIRFFDKPPFMYWMAAASMHLF